MQQSQHKFSSDRAAREKSQAVLDVGELAAIWTGAIRVFGAIKLISWPVQYCLINEGTVRQPHMSEHQFAFALFHHSNRPCEIHTMTGTESESDSIFSDFRVLPQGWL
jgi:hypothetical protein